MNMGEFFDNLAEINEEKSSTFRCPNCGSKVLKKTKYCVKCKKKVSIPGEEKTSKKQSEED